MDSTAQAEGEKRVRRLLVEPLLRRGLAKPASLTRVLFDDMIADLCARLAYMSEANLMALEEQAAGNASGKDKDRFPIANRILDWAAQIQPPGDDASPLIRAVFTNALGREALDEGWAPELLADLRKNRRWPGSYIVKALRESADSSVRQLRILEERLAHGGELSPDEDRWRSRRLAALAKCRDIAGVRTGVRATSEQIGQEDWA